MAQQLIPEMMLKSFELIGLTGHDLEKAPEVMCGRARHPVGVPRPTNRVACPPGRRSRFPTPPHAGPDRWDGHRIEALAFEGGGTKGVVYGGALTRLEQAGLTEGIKCVAGTSAGSQSAALFAFGYTGDEVVKVLGAAPWDKLLDRTFGLIRNINRLVNRFGVFKGDFLEAYIDELLEAKCGLKNCTFAQAFARTGVHLKVGVVGQCPLEG
jgi:predicted acylesterase/phospholipase RssA